MPTTAVSPFPVDILFDLDEVLSTMTDIYSMGQTMIEVNSLMSQLPALSNWEPDASGEICTICREDFSAWEQPSRQLMCTHIYHEQCIISWLALEASCPLCRCLVVIPKVTAEPGSL